MNRALAILLLAGCGAPVGPDATHAYVVAHLAPPTAVGTRSIGFDLDDEVSTGEGGTCEDIVDYSNAAGDTGIDDALVSLVPALAMLLGDECAGLEAAPCVRDFLVRKIGEGALLLLVEVRGVSSFDGDDRVEVQLHAARLASCPDGETCAPELFGSTIVAGQSFRATPLGSAMTGSIEGGVLRAEGGAIDWELPTGQTIPIARVALSAAIFEGGLADGVIGGAAQVDDLRAIADMLAAGFGDDLGAVLEPIADLDVRVGDPRRCEAISAALAFDAVAAQTL